MRLTGRRLLCAIGIVSVAAGFVLQVHATGVRSAIGFLGFASAAGIVACSIANRRFR